MPDGRQPGLVAADSNALREFFEAGQRVLIRDAFPPSDFLTYASDRTQDFAMLPMRRKVSDQGGLFIEKNGQQIAAGNGLFIQFFKNQIGRASCRERV